MPDVNVAAADIIRRLRSRSCPGLPRTPRVSYAGVFRRWGRRAEDMEFE